MKIALIQTPVWGTREPPLALVQLSGSLKAKGIQVKSFDLNNDLYRNRALSFANLWAWEQSSFWYQKTQVYTFFDSIKDTIDTYVDDILNYTKDIVGFSLSASTFYSAAYVMDRIKQKSPSTKIFTGGQMYHDKRNIERTFSQTPADLIVLGEGDVTVPELIKFISEGKDISDCNGICYKKGSETFFTPERELLKNLDALPFMDFSDLKLTAYDDDEHLPLMTSRGCVWNCKFCSTTNFWTGYRQMSAERIHQELSFHKIEYPKAGHIDFQDLALNADVNRLKEFCELLIKYPPFGSKQFWLANVIANKLMTREILELMKQANCKKIIFGIETGSQRVLDYYGKNYKIEDAKRMIKDAYEVGILVTTNFMFGFPGETEEDFEETLNFIRDVGKYIDRVYPSRTYFAMEEFSYVYDNPSEFGVKTPVNHHLYWESVDGKNTYPVRLKRCQRFEELCRSLNVNVDGGVKTNVKLDEFFNLGFYYDYKQDYKTAAEYFKKYLAIDPENEIIKKRLSEIQ
jgi:radical SAM superfamily enzyme YgiQ (UPF0313 family)